MKTMNSFDARTLFSVKGLVAVITGGGTGLGLIFAKALAANGAKSVYIVGRRKDVLEKAAEGHECMHAVQCDVQSKDSLKVCAEAVRAREPEGIDILVANAGVSPSECVAGLPSGGRAGSVQNFVDTLWEVPMETFNRPFEVNVTGVFYSALAFLPLLDARNKHREEQIHKARREGNERFDPGPTPQILVTSSIAGFSRLLTGRFAYSGSKAAATHVAKQLASYLAPWKIRVNVFTPGLVLTEMTQDRAGANIDVEGAVSSETIPAQRWGSESDIAGVALYLLGKAGGYLDGTVLLMDGGRLCVAPSTY